MRRTEAVCVRLTAEEFAAFEELAKVEDRRVSQQVRRLALLKLGEIRAQESESEVS